MQGGKGVGKSLLCGHCREGYGSEPGRKVHSNRSNASNSYIPVSVSPSPCIVAALVAIVIRESVE